MAKRAAKTSPAAHSASNGGIEVLPPPRRKTAERKVNRLHPIQVEYSYPLGSRVDMVDRLPVDLSDEDPDELIDLVSSPHEYEERLAPLSAHVGDEVLTGKNPTELQVKFFRKLAKRLDTVATGLERANRESFGERGPVAFFGLGLDPESIIRIIELDYESADNVYSRMAKLWDGGHVTPVVTMPFHSLMPLYQHEFEIRLLTRIALEFYWPVVRKYNAAVRKHLGEETFVLSLWLPEGGYSARVLEIFHQEFLKRCEEEKVGTGHLVILLDCEQSKERETDALMKRWNTLRPSPTTRDIVSVLFKERLFSEWVVQGHPSTKKQLDRTIAKVDAVLRDRQIDHLWSHFEPIMTLMSTFKTCVSFEQKLIKLTELGYQPCGPDVFVRRKLMEKYGMEENEPRRTTLADNTCWGAHEDTNGSLSRFTGVEEVAAGFSTKRVLAAERPYSRRMPDGTTRRSRGNPCWKPALMESLRRVHRAVVGEPKTFMGGMLGLMRSILPIRRVPVAMRNIEDFLVRYARVHWKEHFIHHVYSEADIRLDEFVAECLMVNLPEDTDRYVLNNEEIVVCGTAAQAIYLAHMGLASTSFAFEHMDHRATYHNVAMMTLAVVHAIHALKWHGDNEEADRIFEVFRTELLDFSNAYSRHGIDKLGVEEKMWRVTIKSQVQDSDLNVVERAARRVGATHLRAMGYRQHFDRKDEHLSTSTGHIWSHEIDHLNIKFENVVFCGLAEE